MDEVPAVEPWPFSAAEAKRRQEQCAVRHGLPPTKKVQISSGNEMEFVLIPPGYYQMGDPEPPRPDAAGWLAPFALLLFAACLGLLFVRTQWRKRKTGPQAARCWLRFSLRSFLLLILCVSCIIGGVMKWRQHQETAARWRDLLSYHPVEAPAMWACVPDPLYFSRTEMTLRQWLGMHQYLREKGAYDERWAPVTSHWRSLYEEMYESTPEECAACGLPLDCIPYDLAQGVIEDFRRLTGVKLRLPSEVEWEYACRAGSAARYCFGDSVAQLGEYSWAGGDCSLISPVGRKKPNAWGLCDMHGNVAEWCANLPFVADRTMGWTIFEKLRAARGGFNDLGAENCRSSARNVMLPADGGPIFVGVRLVLEP
jgi:formylglycine-generating enzyme required for sulfatase activity